MSAAVRHSYPPPLRAPDEEMPYPPGFDLVTDHLSTQDRNYLFGEDETDFWEANVQSDAEDRLELNVDRQTVAAGPGPLNLLPALGLALIVGAVLILVLPQQQLQSHPRCGITTGGQV